MKTIRIILLILLLAKSLNGYSTLKVKEFPLETAIETSEIAFLGELINVSDEKKTYTFKILEIFKGNINRDTLYGKKVENHLYLPSDEKLWIVFGYFKTDSSIVILHSYPMLQIPYFIPAPPNYIKTKSDLEIDRQLRWLGYYSEELSIWFNKLEKLRSYKDTVLQNDKNKMIDYKLFFIIISFIINILLFAILLNKLKK